MKVFSQIIFLILCLCFIAESHSQDSILVKTPKDLIFTSRLNSAGHFPYTGSVLNNHLNADFNLYFRQKNFGFFVFQSIDLESKNSDVTYLQPGLFYKIPLTQKFSVTPYIGYLFIQTNRFYDTGSDVFFAIAPTFVTPKVKIENTSLFTNVFEFGYKRSLANRLQIQYFLQKMSVSLFLFHNIKLSGKDQSLSASLNFQFPKIEIAKNFPIHSALMLQTYLSENKPSYAMRRGAVFSLSFPINLRP